MNDEREAKRLQRIQIDLRELERPFLQLRCEILAVNIPTMQMHQDGKMETFYSPDVVHQLVKVDELWKETRRAYFQRREDFGPNGDATTPGFFK